VETLPNQFSTNGRIASEVDSTDGSSAVGYSPSKKLVALASEATVMVDGEKCVLRVDHVTGRLMACPIASRTCYNKLSSLYSFITTADITQLEITYV